MPETIYEIDGSRAVDKLSKTKRKQQMLELQDLGEELVALSKDALKKTPMSDELREAIKEYQRIPTHGAHRRQMQYIGKLMRKIEDEDVAAIRAALEEQRSGTGTEQTQTLLAEQRRDRLIADEAALTTWLEHFPSTDIQALRSLIRQARKDEAQTAPENANPATVQEAPALPTAAVATAAPTAAAAPATPAAPAIVVNAQPAGKRKETGRKAKR